ncbi:LacI family DNA-binding transcriptional regulator [Flagellimonas sp.]|uniref:LacI family DNA-binding transcriptional regulator n=1 Tax=Flagellimonas sp. TaxID=2058762 RepID=UPI003B51FC7B
MKPTTIKELAELLNLSPSSVSKAISDSHEISEQTKAKVKEMAKVCGYVPNQMARNLKLGKTKSIGVVIPNVRDEFFGMVLHGIEKEASKRKYNLVIHISNDQSKKEKAGLEALSKGTADGILISLARETQCNAKFQHLYQIIDNGIPVVQFDRIHEDLNCDKVSVDDFDGAYQATKHLLETGCERIAFLSPISETSVGKLRKEGYLQALALEQEMVSNPILINASKHEDCIAAVTNAFRSNQIDGILAADELSAICALNSVHSMGLQVPDDVAVVGFTNGLLAKCSIPSLTTVSQHASLLGQTAVATLINRIEGKKKGEEPIHKVIKTELLVRDTTSRISRLVTN